MGEPSRSAHQKKKKEKFCDLYLESVVYEVLSYKIRIGNAILKNVNKKREEISRTVFIMQ